MNFTTDQASALFIIGLVLFAFLLVTAGRAVFSAVDVAEQTVETLMTKRGHGEVLIDDKVQYVGKDPLLHGFYTVTRVCRGPGFVYAQFTGYGDKRTHLPLAVKALPITDIRIHRNGCLLTPV
jgi:hypothetical protein